jgi:hypothetical protein
MARGQAGSAVIPEASKCSRCRARWAQREGFCRTCHPVQGRVDPVNADSRMILDLLCRVQLGATVRGDNVTLAAVRSAKNALARLVETAKLARAHAAGVAAPEER